jgi:hypothetical protein
MTVAKRKQKKRWLVRASCELSTTVEADDETEAILKADVIDISEWESAAWSEYEVEQCNT